MAIELPAGLAELLGQIQSGVRTGFQRSHSIGTAFHRKLSGWLRNIDFNVDAELPVSQIGVRFTDGQVTDYTVQVRDADGTFYVWARNLDRALQLEWKTGDSREFALRNYAIDFAHLDEVNDARRRAAAANDHDAWPERTFQFGDGAKQRVVRSDKRSGWTIGQFRNKPQLLGLRNIKVADHQLFGCGDSGRKVA